MPLFDITLFLDPKVQILLTGAFSLGALLSLLIASLRAKSQLKQTLKQVSELNVQQQQQQQTQLAEQDKTIKALLSEQHSSYEQQMLTQNHLGQLTQQVAGIAQLEKQNKQWQQANQEWQNRASDLRVALETQTARSEQERLTNDEKLLLLQNTEQRVEQQFENLANKIFDQKQQSFSQSSQASLHHLLSPLKEQIEGFKKQVTDQYVKEGQERSALKTEILGLKQLNQQITQDAAALTKALKGDNKAQGNWGEVVLERVLKESGLREGHEFETQVSLKNEAGKTFQPDVIVHLPNDKDVVIDAKVSLAAYERYFNEQEDEVRRGEYLKEHVNSLRQHIKTLGKKDYQDLKGIRTLDYVLIFIPIESAFLLAADQAPELLKLAFEYNIMLVSPTNLLVALRTINNIWQYEYQNQNAQKIADNAGKLYDKVHGFVADMDKIGKGIEASQKSFDAAMNKLASGKGNIIRQVEQFRTLGVQTNKSLDPELLSHAQGDVEPNAIPKIDD
jgi:DNA recombination protein RmuC